MMAGGATAPWARGRGAYRALVRARWDDAAARGTPVIAVHAKDTSSPILTRLGFEKVLQFRRLQDVLSVE
jgi:predicted acetyltransferase